MNMDHYCPFREFALSRAMYLLGLQDDPVDFATQAGFFSELLFRGVTYHSKYIMNNKPPKVVFRSLSDWTSTMESVKADLQKTDAEVELYFCTTQAYGSSPCSSRSTKNASKLWDAAGLWVTFLAKYKTLNRKPSFKETLAFFRRKDMDALMYGIGDLMHMLIIGESRLCASHSTDVLCTSGDMIYAGVVETPSDDEFLRFFLETKKGAYDGLVALNLVQPASKKAGPFRSGEADPIDAQVDTAKSLYNYIRTKLSSVHKQYLLPDMIHFEHLLCKILRLVSSGPLHYVPFTKYMRMKTTKRSSGRKGKKATAKDAVYAEEGSGMEDGDYME